MSGQRLLATLGMTMLAAASKFSQLGALPGEHNVGIVLRRATILLVEDNLNEAELAIQALESHQLAGHLAWAPTGRIALDFLFRRGVYAARERHEPPRLVLLDLKLPRLDGFEVLAQIRGSPDTQHIPVVILSSSSEPDDIARSYDLGANSYITKPVEFEKFAGLLGEIARYWLSFNRPPDER